MTTADREAKSFVSATVAVVATAAPVEVGAPALDAPPALPVAQPASQARPPLQARLQASAGLLLPHAQYRIARLGGVGQVGLAALAAAAVLTVSALLPAQHALQTLSADLERARHALPAASAAASAPQLIASLPTRTQTPAVVEQIFTQAKECGVSLDTGHYVYTPAKGGEIARYELEFPVKASYPDIRKFIDHTLAAVPSVALGKLRVERKVVGDAVVAADIVFVVFVRGGEQP